MTQITAYLKGKILSFYQQNNESINQFIREEIDKLPNVESEQGNLQKISIFLTLKQYLKLKRYCKFLGKKQSGFITELIYKYQNQMGNTSQPTDTKEFSNCLGGDVIDVNH